jgi:hypothetical protein
MSKVKRLSEKNKVSKAVAQRGGDCPQYPAFSFALLTTNSRYSLDYFNNDNDRKTAIELIFKRLMEISKESWVYWYAQRKNTGIETMSAHLINFSPTGRIMTQDEKVIVFRVKSYAERDARIIGIREGGCPILHIIGFDFDYSAYSHG